MEKLTQIADEFEEKYLKESADLEACKRSGYCSSYECYIGMKNLIEQHIKDLRGSRE